MSATIRHLLPAALAFSLMLGGCASTNSSVSVDELIHHTWLLASATDADGKPDTALTGGDRAPIALSFHPDRMGISNACNGMGGDYQVEGDTLKVGNLMQTMMACEPVLMAREDAIKKRLQQPLEMEIDDNASQLILRNNAGVMIFHPSADTTDR
ncbi:Heat shock protein HslJ [Halopseudomonas litoralis]|uniref:Heat shock protein HslJ n=1 Tax=Halopseudomonas litoralis TaxID=797277 RepID=A0A1H1P4Q8_9GAMM|nr:META domain-containing protein [Halopseudomonas litoralis]SDS06153.1 Heat shock protein HslJ [Halopseudomonas litoralis]